LGLVYYIKGQGGVRPVFQTDYYILLNLLQGKIWLLYKLIKTSTKLYITITVSLTLM